MPDFSEINCPHCKKVVAINGAYCPFCRTAMVRCYEQNEEGDWGIRWLCECEPDPNILRGIEIEIAKEEQ